MPLPCIAAFTRMTDYGTYLLINFSTISPVVARSPYQPVASRVTQSLLDERFTSIQRRELGKVLDNLDTLESTLKSSGRNRTETLVEPVSVNAFAQSRLLAVSPGTAISQAPAENLVTNGSFEDNTIRGGFARVQNVNGWTSRNSTLEIWRNLAAPADGEQTVELDNDSQRWSDTLAQTVSTVPGQVYELSFAFAPRPGQSVESNTFDVFFDGELLDTIGASGGQLEAPLWNQYSFTVEAASTDSDILFRETSSNGAGILLDVISLKESTNAVGSSAVNDLAMDTTGTLLSAESVESGSIIINGQSIDIDVDTDSLQDIVNSINSAATGVTASLVSTGTASPQNLELYTIDLASDGSGFSLADNGTNFFTALGLQEGAYGEFYEVSTFAGSKNRGYRAADALESIQESLKTLFASSTTIGSISIQSALTSIFDRLTDRHTESRLSAIGLDVAELTDGFLDISEQSRRRFSKAVYQNNDLVEKLLLESFDQNENGLIEVLRQAIKTGLEDGGSTGNIVNTFA